ncbi:apoptosis regulator BAX-like isoform X1 [Morone saxatilis]|uniref:apoptosis regulator BAX-like isoform X1 n=1 Tax=Morone saxatilis TaxID=34816 RepID=UPI0015E20B9E|nr:apoptosis regulator BAX-like isoform X1 [Morone saxatilis]
MACEGNGMSDERIGEALIKEVIQEELKDVPREDVPPLTPVTGKVKEEEEKVVNQLAKITRIIGDRVKDDAELKDAIDGFIGCPSSCSMSDRFKEVANKVLESGITWERIAVLFYVAGKLAHRMVEAHIPQSVRDILRWTMEFFRINLLGWIREHGGWINSFSDLATVSMQSVSSMSSQSSALALIFISGLAIGSFISWRLTRQS